MAKPFLIIDGYNLMHAVGLARKRYGPGDLERSRTRLLNYLLNHLSSSELHRTTIVFDARNAPPGVSREMSLHGMTILFAASDSDADTLIEKLILDHSAPRQIRIISSDHRLQQAARRRRGSFADSEDFSDELEGRIEKQQQPQSSDQNKLQQLKNSGKLSPDETEAWLQEFGEEIEKDEAVTDELERLQEEIDELSKNEDWLNDKHP